MIRSIALGTGVATLLACPAYAHHPSGSSSTGGAGPIATISATTLEKGTGVAGIVFETVHIDAFSDSQLVGFATNHVHAHSLDTILAPSLVLAYGLTNDFTISARLPVVVRQNIREGSHVHPGGGAPAENSVVELGDSSGIGDLTLMGQYRFYNNRAAQLEMAVLVGVNLPTGRTNVINNEGERFETEFQPGSGAFGGLVGLAVTKRVGAWSLDANVLYEANGTGAQDTDLGDRLLYNAGVSYRIYGGAGRSDGRMHAGLPEPMYHGGPKAHDHGHDHHHEAPAPRGPSLDLVLELNGEWHDRQRIAGVTDPNSGGNVVYLSPGVRLSMDKWSGFVSVGVPVVNDMYGVQAEPDWRLLAGVSMGF
jgi:outer membrane putative beta-barrel porin/alpha-amylase